MIRCRRRGSPAWGDWPGREKDRGLAVTLQTPTGAMWETGRYPEGLEDGQIPFAARVFAVADVFDALTSNRPYHKKVPCDEAQELIQKDSDTHFDPEVVRAFLRIPCTEWHRIDQGIAERPTTILQQTPADKCGGWDRD